MKSFHDKFHLIFRDTDRSQTIGFCNGSMKCSRCEKLLGVKIDANLKFEEHVK